MDYVYLQTEDIMYQRVMVAVDGSETAQRGLKEAIALAKDQKAQLAIVHVMDIVVVYAAGQFPGTYIEGLRESAQRTIAQACNAARAEGIEPEVKSPEIMSSGSHVADTLIEAAEAWRADVLVIGTHGYRGFRHLLLGSVAEGVVRAATMPVLLIRHV